MAENTVTKFKNQTAPHSAHVKMPKLGVRIVTRETRAQDRKLEVIFESIRRNLKIPPGRQIRPTNPAEQAIQHIAGMIRDLLGAENGRF